MMRWIILAVLVVVISATATVIVQTMPLTGAEPINRVEFPTPKPGLQPKAVVVGDSTYHFGAMSQQGKGHKTWTIRNEGKADLVLKGLGTTCQCTVSDLKAGETKVVKPGDSTEIELVWDPSKKKTVGQFSQSASIGTNDPGLEKIELMAQGMVRPAVMMFPADETVNFLEISNDQEDHAGHGGLYTADKEDFEITGIVSSNPDAVSVDKEPMSADDLKKYSAVKGYRLTVHAKSALPLGAFREEVVIKTNHPLEPEMKLYVIGKMIGPISVTPERVRFTPPDVVSSRRGGTKVLRLMVRGQSETHFQVEKQPARCKVEFEPGAKLSHSSEYRMTVTFLPGVAPGTVEGEIILKTDHPKAAEVKVPVIAYVSDTN